MFIVPLKAPGVEIKPVYTFQDERTNITFYDGVKIPDSYRLGEVNAGVKVMSAGLELEHGGGFAKSQRKMVQAAEHCAAKCNFDGRAADRGPRTRRRGWRGRAAHLALSEVLAYRALWAGAEKKPEPRPSVRWSRCFRRRSSWTDSADLLNLTAPYSLSKREGPAAFLNQCYRHAHGTTHLRRHQRGPSQHDRRTQLGAAPQPRLTLVRGN